MIVKFSNQFSSKKLQKIRTISKVWSTRNLNSIFVIIFNMCNLWSKNITQSMYQRKSKWIHLLFDKNSQLSTKFSVSRVRWLCNIRIADWWRINSIQTNTLQKLVMRAIVINITLPIKLQLIEFNFCCFLLICPKFVNENRSDP